MDFGIAIHIDDFVNVLQKFLSTFQIKKLCLDIRYDQFMALSTLPALSSFMELDIVLTIYSPDPMNETNGGLAPHLFSRLRSVTFKRPNFAMDLFDRLFVSSLPWSQRSFSSITITRAVLLISYVRFQCYKFFTSHCVVAY